MTSAIWQTIFGHMKKGLYPGYDWSVANNAELALRVEEGLPVLDLVDFGRID